MDYDKPHRYCVKHRCNFVLVPERGYVGPDKVMHPLYRCEQCVAEARAKVRLEIGRSWASYKMRRSLLQGCSR